MDNLNHSLVSVFFIISCFLCHMWGYYRGKADGIDWMYNHYREIFGEDDE